MKKCVPLWREARFKVQMLSTACSDHFWTLRCSKCAPRCGAKHISKSKLQNSHMFRPLLDVHDTTTTTNYNYICKYNYNYITLHKIQYNSNYTYNYTFNYTTTTTPTATTRQYTTLHYTLPITRDYNCNYNYDYNCRYN